MTLATPLLALVLAIVLVPMPDMARASGVPVVDAAALAQAVQDYAKLTEQLTTMQSQLTQLQGLYATATSQYNELRGITEHARMLADPIASLHNLLPDGIDLSSVWTGASGTLAEQVRAAKETVSVDVMYPPNQPMVTSVRDAYQARSDYIFGYLALAKQAYEAARARRASLATLAAAAGTASTPKAVMDLTARATAEGVLVENDMVELMALTLLVEMEGKALEHNTQAAMHRKAPPTPAPATSTPD